MFDCLIAAHQRAREASQLQSISATLPLCYSALKYWQLGIGTGNAFTLATFLTSCEQFTTMVSRSMPPTRTHPINQRVFMYIREYIVTFIASRNAHHCPALSLAKLLVAEILSIGETPLRRCCFYRSFRCFLSLSDSQRLCGILY